MKRDKDHFRGCLIGGAAGDALGWPVEFMKLDGIINHYGPDGIQDLEISSSGKAEITDDTQMTLFTAEGILRAKTIETLKGICHPAIVVYHAYQRWLLTQGYPKIEEYEWAYDGWLLGIKELYMKRAPGQTCLSSLASGKIGTIEHPINNSKGCGGVMRVAPAGLFYRNNAFQAGAEFAAITHGYPSGYLSAGAFAHIVAMIIEGHSIEDAVISTLKMLERYDNHKECKDSLIKAMALAKDSLPDNEAIRQLGEGWVGEEALSISIYCALKHRNDFRKALIAAVNHDGDSDSTGAITGNIMGAYLGFEKIPAEWIRNLELADILIQMADDLLIEYDEDNVNWNRYPGY